MALNFIQKKYKDVYSIENVGLTTINYNIQTRECDSLNSFKSGIILPGETFILPINFLDAIYVVTLSDDDEEEVYLTLLMVQKNFCVVVKNVMNVKNVISVIAS